MSVKFALATTTIILLAACQSGIGSTEQEWAQFQQDNARLNRVYADTENALAIAQQSDVSVAAARQHFAELRRIQAQKCAMPSSFALNARLQYGRCQYDAKLDDLQRLQQWQKIRFQFPPRGNLGSK